MAEKYLVSLLISSNNKTNLNHTLSNIFSSANLNNINFEVIIKLDLDDVILQKNILKYQEYKNIKFLISHKLNGYLNLVEFTEQMINCSQGKYVWMLGDDIEIDCSHWNDVLADKLIDFKLYYTDVKWWVKETNIPFLEENQHKSKIDFLIFPKKVKEIWSESLCPHHLSDMWVSRIFNLINVSYNTSVTEIISDLKVKHLRPLSKLILGKSNTPQEIWDEYDKYNGSALFYHNTNLIYEYIMYLKYNQIYQHNIINNYRNDNNIK